MRLTLSRAALVALALTIPAANLALGQDQSSSSGASASQAPSSQAPSSETPSASQQPASSAASSEAPASEQPSSQTSEPASSAPSSEAPGASSSEPPPDQSASKPDDRHPRTADEVYQNLNFFGEVFDRIRAQYVDPPDEQFLIRAAINGMLTALDPHSQYMDPAEFDQTKEDTSGQFGGLGIEVTMDQGVIKVVSPIDDTPAAKAGILANDYIVELDGKSIQGMTLDDAVAKMKGPIGSKIKLTVVRDGIKDPLYFELARDTISQTVVKYTLEGDVAVIRLVRFTEQAFPGLQKAIKGIYDDRKGVAPKGIVLDLRNNPGGLVDQAEEISDAFLKQGTVVLTRGRTDADSSRYEAKPDDLDAKLAAVPLVVLINGSSASAAEIVAGALQDHKRATLVGSRSFGKGTVQSVIPLGDNGGIKMTTARYYTPSNRSIQAAGIQPDIAITEDVPDDLKGKVDLLGEAGYSDQIGGGTETQATTGSSVYVNPDKTKDNQLQYAIKLIDGTETNDAYPPKADG